MFLMADGSSNLLEFLAVASWWAGTRIRSCADLPKIVKFVDPVPSSTTVFSLYLERKSNW